MYAVITGDIIQSTRLKEKATYLKQLRTLFEILRKNKKEFGLLRPFEIFRGDSFQAVFNKPEKSLKIALILRSFSKMNLPKNTRKMKGKIAYTHLMTDLRISVGIGQIDPLSKKVVESDGEAFQRSGRQLDQMKKEGQNLAINTPWRDLNNQFEASWRLVDAIVSKWSPFQAEAVYHVLLEETNSSIAKAIGASSAAVSQRLKTANWVAIQGMLLYFEETIAAKIK